MADVLPDGARLAWVAGDPATPSRGRSTGPSSTARQPLGRLRARPGDGEPSSWPAPRRPEPLPPGTAWGGLDPASTLGLWVAPGPRQDELAAGGTCWSPTAVGADPQADEGSVGIVDGPHADGDRVRAPVEVTRPTGAPWPTVAPGGKAIGRIRLGVAVEGARCGCRLLGDIAGPTSIRWVDGDDARITVEVDLPLATPADEDEELTLRVRLLLEGVGAFGDPAEARFG